MDEKNMFTAPPPQYSTQQPGPGQPAQYAGQPAHYPGQPNQSNFFQVAAIFGGMVGIGLVGLFLGQKMGEIY